MHTQGTGVQHCCARAHAGHPRVAVTQDVRMGAHRGIHWPDPHDHNPDPAKKARIGTPT